MFSSSLRVFAIFSIVATLSSALPQPASEVALQSLPGHQKHQIGSRLGKRASAQDYLTYAVAGINQLQTWWSAADGLYDALWWPSANVITMLADFQQYYPSQGSAISTQVFPTTHTQAPNTYSGFLNDYYDDGLWWALAWIQVYDVTGDATYLDTAVSIFEDSRSIWGDSPCGGLWWDKAHTQVGAVENELYLTTAAKLANRLPSTPSEGYYYNEAITAYTWFVDSGLINSDNLINNGLDLTTCKNDGNYVFSYNQGIILSGLAELTWASGDDTYNELANTIAIAAIANLTDSAGILHEPCEPDSCNADTEQFKGILARNIQFLYQRATVLPTDTATLYKDFLTTNANSIWADSQVDNQLGLVWSGPIGTSTVQTQSSALDAIVGAACVSL